MNKAVIIAVSITFITLIDFICNHRKKKKVYPHPAPLSPKRKSDRFFFLQSRGEPRTSASSTRAAAGHYCQPFSALEHHEAGENRCELTLAI